MYSMNTFKLLIILHCIFISKINAVELINGEFESFDLFSNKPIEYHVVSVNYPQLVIIKNHEITTYAELSINGSKKYYAS